MSTTGSRLLTSLLAATFSFTLAAQQQGGTVTTETTSPADYTPDTTPPHGTYPEIVRLSLVEGDVRIARGKQDAKLTGNTWEQAAAGIPLASGFNLATGPNGRAEIEFEDASTVYLAPNSALSLPELSTKDGIPHTKLTLLSGTVTLNLKPNLRGETYTVETPTDRITLSDGDENYTRITSYLDGLRVTPMEYTHLVLNGLDRPADPGSTYELRWYGLREVHIQPSADLVAFDAWVKQRVLTREAAMKLVMHESGLKEPLPGLADLAGNGTFVPCAPYGTCWKPNDGWAPHHAAPSAAKESSQSQPAPAFTQPHIVLASLELPASEASMPQTAGMYDPYDPFDDLADFDDLFPCNPYAFWWYQQSAFYDPADFYPYDWAVCHAGYWINRNNQYLWVAGTHRHHRCPVHWVKVNGKLGFVPDHPRDRRGGVPVNLRHGIFTLSQRSGHTGIERIAFEGKSPPHALESTPKEFRNASLPRLARADSPQLGVHFMHESSRAASALHGGSARTATSSLTFDDHHDRFMLTSRVTDGGRTRTFSAPMSSRGGNIAPASAGGYHQGFAGGAPSHAGGGFSGGGSHGGGFSGGGGGSHGGGGGGGGGHSGGGGGGGFSGGSPSGGGASSGGGGGHH
ncbi:MAG TPA: FecR family protein [Candidatus Aquilonibacter sp.]|nr:FecR family protein [Candidatus Aquilonibacter sp.]